MHQRLSARAGRPRTGCPPSETRAVSIPSSSRTGKTSISRCGSGMPGGGAPGRGTLAPCTGTGDARCRLAGQRTSRRVRTRVRARSIPRRESAASYAVRIALLDWPVLLVHLVVRRELGPIRARARGARAGAAQGGLRAPVELATVGLAEALRRQYGLLLLRFTGGLPQHFRRASQATTTGTRAAPPSDPV